MSVPDTDSFASSSTNDDAGGAVNKGASLSFISIFIALLSVATALPAASLICAEAVPLFV